MLLGAVVRMRPALYVLSCNTVLQKSQGCSFCLKEKAWVGGILCCVVVHACRGLFLLLFLSSGVTFPTDTSYDVVDEVLAQFLHP